MLGRQSTEPEAQGAPAAAGALRQRGEWGPGLGLFGSVSPEPLAAVGREGTRCIQVAVVDTSSYPITEPSGSLELW